MRKLDRVTLAAFVFMILLGGLNGIGVRFTVQELPPFWGAVLRFTPASLLLFALVLAQRLPLPKGRSLLGALLFGALNFGGSYAFIYWGLQEVQPGMTSVILAVVPLLTLLFAALHHQEVLSGRALAGSLLAVGGIALVFGEQIQANIPLVSLLAVVLGAVCFAWSGVLIKMFPMGSPVSTNAVAMAAGAALLMLVSLAFREPLVVPVRPATWAALVYLILLGSCVVFILALFVLKRWTASATSYSFVLMPFVTIAVSAWINREPLTPALLAGASLVITGVYFGALRPAGTHPRVKAKAGSTEP